MTKEVIMEQQESERKFGKILDAEAVKTKQEAEAFFEEKQKVSFLVIDIFGWIQFWNNLFSKIMPNFS